MASFFSCKAHALIYHRFVYWRRKFDAEAQSDTRESSGSSRLIVSGVEAGLGVVLPPLSSRDWALQWRALRIYQSSEQQDQMPCREDNGFVLYYKSLAEEKFRWPRKGDEVVSLTGQQINCPVRRQGKHDVFQLGGNSDGQWA